MINFLGSSVLRKVNYLATDSNLDGCQVAQIPRSPKLPLPLPQGKSPGGPHTKDMPAGQAPRHCKVLQIDKNRMPVN